MILTQRQQMLIARYLREVADTLGDVSDDTRDRVLRRVKNRLDADLRKRPAGVLADEDVVEALARLGSAADQAEEASLTNGGGTGLALSIEHRRWLGVCGGVADYLGLNVTVVRAIFILLGCTGPVAPILYLALYAEMYLVAGKGRGPSIDYGRLAGRTLGPFAAAIALHAGIRGLLRLMRYAYEDAAKLGPFPDIGHWNWLPANASFLLFCALSLSLPLAVLSGLPLANEWDRTLKRCALAIIALYAAGLSVGLALFLTGIILHLSQGISL